MVSNKVLLVAATTISISWNMESWVKMKWGLLTKAILTTSLSKSTVLLMLIIPKKKITWWIYNSSLSQLVNQFWIIGSYLEIQIMLLNLIINHCNKKKGLLKRNNLRKRKELKVPLAIRQHNKTKEILIKIQLNKQIDYICKISNSITRYQWQIKLHIIDHLFHLWIWAL